MKNAFPALVTLGLALSLAGCGGGESNQARGSVDPPATEAELAEDAALANAAAAAEAADIANYGGNAAAGETSPGNGQ